MKFTPISTRHLGNEDMHALSSATLAICAPHREIFEASAQSAFDLLKSSTTTFGAQLNRNRGSMLTKDIKAEDVLADKVWKEIKSTLTRTAKSVVDAAKAKAAEELMMFLKPYWSSEVVALNTQVANFTEMFSKYDGIWKEKGKTAGIDTAMKMLESSNAKLGALWQQRNDLQGDMAVNLSASKLRAQTGQLYKRFCSLIEGQQQFTPNDTLRAMITDINEARGKYASLISSRKTARENKKQKEGK